MSSINLKFAPTDEAQKICTDAIKDWASQHNITENLDEQSYRLASRVSSWISPRSVIAGVQDILSAHLGKRYPPEVLQSLSDLGDNLGRKLEEAGLLKGSAKRLSNLGV